MGDIILEFENVTKYPLVDFFKRYEDFMLNSYPVLDRYFSGETKTIENNHLNKLKKLTNDCKDILAQFENFSNKLNNCGYWELMDYINDLKDVIDKINKFPKFKRTSLTKRGYYPYIQVTTSVGGKRTMEDVADSVKNLNKDNLSWIDLMLNNNLNEEDWEIDQLTSVNLFINNKTDIVVTTILDEPIGDRIYGIDINKKISFKDNDLEVVTHKENINQKCVILLELNRGDVPENRLFGKNMNIINNVNQFSYPEIINDIKNNFLQNDLFEFINVKEFKFEEGSMNVTVEIKTKYDYKTEKKITI